MYLSVVLLDDRTQNVFQVLFGPIDVKRSGYRFFETFVAFKNLFRTSDPAHGKKAGMAADKPGLGIGKAFPVAEGAGAGHAQGVIAGPRDRDGVRSLLSIETERTGNAGGGGIGALHSVIKAFRSDRSHIAQTPLNLVSHRHR